MQFLTPQNSYYGVASALLLTACVASTPVPTPSPAWSPHSGEVDAPVRCIVERKGKLIGARADTVLSLWESEDGMVWEKVRDHIAHDTKPETFGDITTWCGGIGVYDDVIIIAYREQWSSANFSVSMMASFDGGVTWSDRILIKHPPSGANRFVGAPFIKQLPNETLLIFYDSEDYPTNINLPGSQFIVYTNAIFTNNLTSPFTFGGERVASRQPPNSTEFSRDGMATVVDVAPGWMAVICEGVAKNAHGVQQDVIYQQIMSVTGEVDFVKNRSVVYAPQGTVGNRSFNAFCPYATLVKPEGGSEKILVVFSTDEDAATPAIPGFNPYAINTTVKYVTTPLTAPYTPYTPPSTIYASAPRTYLAGVMTTSNQTLVSTIRLQDGEEMIFTNPHPEATKMRFSEYPRYRHDSVDLQLGRG